MKAAVSWLRDYAALPAELNASALAEVLVRAGLEVEAVDHLGADITGPVVIGRVVDFVEEAQKNGKVIRWCQVDVSPAHGGSRGIVCGARNFAAGDFVVVALPGSMLPGPLAIAARKTYGHVSDGMMCSARELGLGEDHHGILVLDEADADVVVGADAPTVLQLRDDVLDIAVTPDRGYCLSMRGLAREAAQAMAVPFTDPVNEAPPPETTAGFPVQLESGACPLFVARTVAGIDPSRPSPRWLARRVQLAGMRSISLTVDISNYVMVETGQPIHIYDADQLDGGLEVRQARPGERLTTLDDVVRPLHADDLVIADRSGPIGLAGVMGGASTAVSGSTTRVVIESAHFDAITIARSSRRHKLSSEASRRFERGVDPAATYAAAGRVAHLLVSLAGGVLMAEETVRGALPLRPATTLPVSLPGAILGTQVDPETVVRLIETVGARVVANEGVLAVTPPSWRPDLTDPYDYVEEIGRLLGFDTIPAVIPRAPVGRGLTRAQRARRAVASAVAANGYVEVLSFPFLSIDELDRLGVPADDERRQLNKIINPLSDTSPYLRTTLLPGLLAATGRNLSRGLEDLALFESASVFFAADPPVTAPRPAVVRRPTVSELAAMDVALGRQPRHLAAVVTGQWRGAGWSGPAEPASWTHAVGFVDTAARAIGLALERRAVERAPWHPGRCAALSLDGVVLGYAGELHPTVCLRYGLPARTAAAEVDLDALVAAAPDRGDIRAISTYPIAKEDVALIVDDDVPAALVEGALRAGAGSLLESIALFDRYVGEQIGPGKKSLAYALRFRAPDRTLTDVETAKARDAAVTLAAERTGAVQRTI